MKNPLILAAILLALGSARASAQTGAAPLSRIGAAGAVRGSVKAVAPNVAVGRIIESGKPLFLNDHVTTDAEGRLQVMLLDETVFTLGPDADMTLDEFVYDPKTSAGKVSAEVSKGAFRFVTGKVARANPSNMKVKLAVGTIGIRGTIVAGETGKAGSTVLNVGEGTKNNAGDRPSAIMVSNTGTTRLVDLSGQGVTVKPGQAPSFPHDMADEIKRISGILAIAPKNNPGKEPGNGASAGENSGQLTAAIKDLVNDIQADEQTQSGSQAEATLAAQHSQDQFGVVVPDGITTWDFIRQNQPSGQGYYFTDLGTLSSCTNCTSAAAVGSVQLQIDFAARTLGGSGGITNPVSTVNGSFIHLHGVSTSGNTDTIQQTIGLGGSSPIPFSSLTGPATITLNGTNLGTVSTNGGFPFGGTGSFSGTTISLVNAGGVVAKNASTTLVFSGTGNGLTATASTSASGTIVSPRF